MNIQCQHGHRRSERDDGDRYAVVQTYKRRYYYYLLTRYIYISDKYAKFCDCFDVYFAPRRGMRSIAISGSVCLFVCVLVCLLAFINNYTYKRH